MLGLVVLLSGCASVENLPTMAREVGVHSFDDEKIVKWDHEDCILLEQTDMQTAFRAAKHSLTANGFSIERARFDDGAVLGEHGVSAHYWNLVAGVYFHQQQKGVAFTVIVIPSHTSSLVKDRPGPARWRRRIFDEIESYARAELPSQLPAMACRPTELM